MQLYADRLPARDGGPGTAVNLGEAGLTSAGLLHEVQTSRTMQLQLRRATVVLLTIGANDLQGTEQSYLNRGCPASCYRPALEADGRRILAILKHIRALDTTRTPTVLVTGYWNVFLDGAVATKRYGAAYVSWSSMLTVALNDRIWGDAKQTGATFVDLYTPFKGDGSKDPTADLAEDGDHPNAEGHAAIAGALLAATG